MTTMVDAKMTDTQPPLISNTASQSCYLYWKNFFYYYNILLF